MAYPSADKRRVYLACRAIFAGNNAQLRKQKKIREVVLKHQASLRPLIRDFTLDKVVDILKTLLEKQIFQSEVKAKIEFPELFVSSPARDVQRAASENDAARSAAELLEEIASLEERENEADEDENEIAPVPSDKDDAGTGKSRILRALKQIHDFRSRAYARATEYSVTLSVLFSISRSACHSLHRAMRPGRMLL